LNNDISDNHDLFGVYKKPYTIKNIQEIENTLKYHKIISPINKPSYNPRKIIRENQNDFNDAFEIGVILKNEEERNILNDAVIKISPKNSIKYITSFPTLAFFNIHTPKTSMINKTGIGNSLYNKIVNGDDITGEYILDGVYRKIYNIKDLDLIIKTLTNKKIQKSKPTYTKRKLIYESSQKYNNI